MVTVGPPKYNLGTQLGEALGMGAQQGMGQGLQRGLTNQGFDQLIKSLGPENQDLVNAVNVLRQGALNPGADRAAAAIAPMMIGRTRTNQLYGSQERGGAAPMAPAEASREAQKFALGDEPAGFFAPPMNPDQMQKYAERRAQVLGNPNAYSEGLAEAATINQSREQSRLSFENAAREMGVPAQDLPRYMQMATEFQNEKDPAKINRATFQKYQRIENLKDSMENFVVPGIGTRLFEEKPKVRDQYLKRMNETVSNLIKEGEEPFVRQKLGGMGLSPTEVEERIHPLTPDKEKALSGLPRGDKMNPKGRQEALVNFFRKNVDNDTSLSVLRQHLFENMGYDWKEVAQAISTAFPAGDRLNQWQNAEMSNINSPPKQSLQSIFGPASDWRNFLRGAK